MSQIPLPLYPCDRCNVMFDITTRQCPNCRCWVDHMPRARDMLAFLFPPLQLQPPPPPPPPSSMSFPPNPMGQLYHGHSSFNQPDVASSSADRPPGPTISRLEFEKAIIENREAGKPIRRKQTRGADKRNPMYGPYATPPHMVHPPQFNFKGSC
jgi:hypothetical protein